MPNVSFTDLTSVPAEYSTELENINRRRRLQEALLSQSLQQPQTQMTGGRYSRAVPYSPLQGASKLIQAALLKRGMGETGEQLESLGERYRGSSGEEVRNLMAQSTGAAPWREPDPQGAIMAGAGSPYPEAQRVAEAMLQTGKMESGKERGSYFRPVETRDGRIMLLNSRTGEMTDTGKYAAKYDIPTTEALSGARTTGKAEATRKFNMSGIGQTINRARDLMSGVDSQTGEITGDLPTESGVGAAYDWLSALVGYSPEGAKEATALKAIGGALTAKMPRMEGPQSDKDTLLYREMAAQVGDKTIPLDQRRFALQEVERLWAKYEDLNQDVITPKSGSINKPAADAPIDDILRYLEQ